MTVPAIQSLAITRRSALLGASAATWLAATETVRAATITLPLPGGAGEREIVPRFADKRDMILLRTRPPLLETPLSVFDRGVFTPNDQFYVRWHLAGVPTEIDVGSFRLAVRGHVNQTLSLSLADLLAMPRVEVAAVNQCSGNSRGFFQPRVAGGEWGHGAMGCAKWTGVRLRDVLDRAGVKAGAVQARFKGLDEGAIPETPHFIKSLPIDRARDGEVIIAFLMNGEPLPLLNGFPIRLVVPGWYATYWMKMLSDIEVLETPDDNFWMKTAYQIPDTPGANVKPGETGYKTVPINRMVTRSFFTNLTSGQSVPKAAPLLVRGIAMGGDQAVAKVELSTDAGATWMPATLGPDEGRYAFRAWSATLHPSAAGPLEVLVRATNGMGETQPMQPIWNPGGYMLNTIEKLQLTLA